MLKNYCINNKKVESLDTQPSASAGNSGRKVDINKPPLPERYRAISYKVKKLSTSTRNSGRKVDINRPFLPERFQSNSYKEKIQILFHKINRNSCAFVRLAFQVNFSAEVGCRVLYYGKSQTRSACFF